MRWWLGPEPIDRLRDLLEQPVRQRDLDQLGHSAATMAPDPGADLHELLVQGRQRSVLDLFGQSRSTQEVVEIVG